MKQLTDEQLNKYLDKELDVSEITQLKKYLTEHPEDMEKFKAHLLVDDILKGMTNEKAPANFTERLMSRISSTIHVEPKKSYFMRFIFSIFGLSIMGFIIMAFLNPVSANNSPNNKLAITEIIESLIAKLASLIGILNSEITMIVGSALTLVILVSTYIIYYSHKSFKNKLERLSH